MIVILALGDKGCSAEGGLTGTINNMATQNGFLDNVATMLQHIDELGSPLHENQSFENSKCCGTPGRKNIFWHASQADEDIWCAPELLRAQAHRLVLSGGGANHGAAEAILLHSLGLARRHDVRAWEFRAATSLGLLYLRSSRSCEAREVLEPALMQFKQGYDTRDIQAANNVCLLFPTSAQR